jgi:subtilisin-like proprotein convertase family protein
LFFDCLVVNVDAFKAIFGPDEMNGDRRNPVPFLFARSNRGDTLMSKLRMFTLIGLMVAGLSPLYGCGSECAEGTTDKDGQCVVDAKGCAAGTELRSGECLLDTSGCGANTVLGDDGVCVAAEETCGGNSIFDADTRTCAPDTSVVCGQGTEVGDDGVCVPGEEACSDLAMLDDSGRCVIAAAACGAGTALDPVSNECLLAAEGCGAGLALDADSGMCVSTEDVCDAGTKFDAESGLCLNDSCNLGDVLIDGVCTLPAQELAANANLSESENNDPALGGTAEGLAVNLVGDDPYVFKGAIGAPTDLDNDGQLDQDIDVYEFAANAGEWFEITVQAIGLQAPAFVVEGPNDYLRYSPVGRARDAAREIVTPFDGAYTITVLPSMVLQTEGEITTFGSPDWTYVGTLGAISVPDASQMDISSGAAQLSGDYAGLRDNLFELTNLGATDLVSITATSSGAGAQGVLQQWESETMLVSQQMLSSGDTVDLTANGAGSALLLFDWIHIDGPNTDFEVTAETVGSQATLTMLSNTTEVFTVSAAANEYVVAGQTNPSDTDLDVKISDSTGTEVAAGALGSGNELRYLTTTPGDFTVEFINSSASNVDATLTAKAVGIPVLGPISLSDSDTYTSNGVVPFGESRLHKLIVDEAGALTLNLVSSNSFDYTYVRLFDSTMTSVVPEGDRGLVVSSITPGTYFVEIEPEYDDISYTLTASLAGPPDFSSAPGLAIPDGDIVTGASDTMEVTGCTTITDVSVYFDISHGWRGDLDIDLTSPNGTTVRLWEDTGGSTEDLIGWMPMKWTPANSLAAFNGTSGNGEWTLTVYDDADIIAGTLNEWGLTLTCQ